MERREPLYIVTSEEMRQIDLYVIEELGVPAVVLMERAGLGVAEAIRSLFSQKNYPRVIVLSGPGNNGGDGFVCARYLWDWGYQVEVLLFKKDTEYQGEAEVNLNILKNLGIPTTYVSNLEEVREFFRNYRPDLVVDALFGTGLKRPLSGLFEEVVSYLNDYRNENSKVRIVAIDMPSGVSGDTGQILGVAVRADLTVTFECLKPAHLFYPGKERSGEVKVIPIGYPWQAIKNRYSASLKRVYLDDYVAKTFYRGRRGFFHKGKAGHLLILAGSHGKSGAGFLAGLGALRGGVGLVTLASPKSLQPIYCQLLPEALTLGLPEENGEISENALKTILSALDGKKALAIGPGFGLGKGPEVVLSTLLETVDLPLILDADALTLISKFLEKLRAYRGVKIITPHPGEAGRLLGVSAQQILKDPLKALSELIHLTGATVILKGPHTLIGEPSGQIFVSSIDEPGMAQGGMGDVLTGLLGALISQGYSSIEASCLGVYLHGRAGLTLHRLKGPFGFTATEVANYIPLMINELETLND